MNQPANPLSTEALWISELSRIAYHKATPAPRKRDVHPRRLARLIVDRTPLERANRSDTQEALTLRNARGLRISVPTMPEWVVVRMLARVLPASTESEIARQVHFAFHGAYPEPGTVPAQTGVLDRLRDARLATLVPERPAPRSAPEPEDLDAWRGLLAEHFQPDTAPPRTLTITPRKIAGLVLSGTALILRDDDWPYQMADRAIAALRQALPSAPWQTVAALLAAPLGPHLGELEIAQATECAFELYPAGGGGGAIDGARR